MITKLVNAIATNHQLFNNIVYTLIIQAFLFRLVHQIHGDLPYGIMTSQLVYMGDNCLKTEKMWTLIFSPTVEPQ